MREQQNQQYHQFVGEYIGLMASLENALTILLIEYLHVQDYRDEFSEWFIEASIPFSYKVNLLKRMLKDNVILSTNFPNFWDDLHELQKYRNILAHSFWGFNGFQNCRGDSHSTENIELEAIQERLSRLKSLESTVRELYCSEIEGSPRHISSDDFADWPN